MHSGGTSPLVYATKNKLVFKNSYPVVILAGVCFVKNSHNNHFVFNYPSNALYMMLSIKIHCIKSLTNVGLVAAIFKGFSENTLWLRYLLLFEWIVLSTVFLGKPEVTVQEALQRHKYEKNANCKVSLERARNMWT